MKTKFMKYALNYDRVVNFVCSEEDDLTNQVISYYKNYILGIIPKKKYKTKIFDNVVNKYLTDIYFHDYVTNNIDCSIDLYYDLDDYMLNLYRKYLNNQSRKITTSRWL